MNEAPVATSVGGLHRRLLSFHSVKQSGEPRHFYVTVVDALAGTGMQVELALEEVAHLAEVLAAASRLFD